MPERSTLGSVAPGVEEAVGVAKFLKEYGAYSAIIVLGVALVGVFRLFLKAQTKLEEHLQGVTKLAVASNEASAAMTTALDKNTEQLSNVKDGLIRVEARL